MYKGALGSYRDLPIRYSEMGRCHRNERSGTLSGLVRVRQFTQDDAHIYCRPEQLQVEITDLLDLVREWYGVFGLPPSYRLASRPPDKLGTDHMTPPRTRSPAMGAHGRLTNSTRAGRVYGPRSTSPCGRARPPVAAGHHHVDLTMLPSSCSASSRTTPAKRPVVIHRVIFGS